MTEPTPYHPCLPVRRPARCHRRDLELAENSEDVIDWLLAHQTGYSSAKMRRVVGRRGSGEEAPDASPFSASKALVNPSRSATVTVSAVAARRSGDGTFSAKWMHTPALWFVPKLKPS